MARTSTERRWPWIAAALVAALWPASVAARAPRQVFACEPEWAALVREVGGGGVVAFSATHARQDPHHIEARPALVARLRTAQLVVCTGAELEVGWMPVLLRQANNAAVQPGQSGHIDVADYFELVDKPARLDRAMGDVHAAGNPHLHLDPRVIRVAAGLVAQRMMAVDPERSEAYRAGLARFEARWDIALANWERRSAPLIGARVASHHKNFSYLWRWLGMSEVATLEPLPGVPPGAGQLAALVTSLPRLGVEGVVHAAFENDRAARFVAERTSLPLILLPYTVRGSGKAADLFGLFDDTIDRLLESLRPTR
ncbi:MAG: zinc ABC transporter substrate-binding protein [Alphaproteobacteria bacterium]|nr:zinc ABC transporter substrate-binding protein [Alphaproteobacteria bacterium]